MSFICYYSGKVQLNRLKQGLLPYFQRTARALALGFFAATAVLPADRRGGVVLAFCPQLGQVAGVLLRS